METKNLLLPSLSNRKCVGLSLLNRVPEADLELKMYEIRRDYVKFKENTRHEEGKMWDELYNNHRELRKSYVSKYSPDEILHNKELFYLPRVQSYSADSPPKDSPVETPFAVRYKQFVTFKANTMRHMHLRQCEKRPNYMDLYAKQFDKQHKNQDNFHKVLVKFENKRKEGHGALNILKDQQESASQEAGSSNAGSSFRETGRPQKEDGGCSSSSKASRSGLSGDGEELPQRKRKLGIAQNLTDSDRFNTLPSFDAGVNHGRSQPPQLTKFPTLAGGPRKV